MQNEVSASSEQAKAKPTKAERRALQEAQRAAKGLDTMYLLFSLFILVRDLFLESLNVELEVFCKCKLVRFVC